MALRDLPRAEQSKHLSANANSLKQARYQANSFVKLSKSLAPNSQFPGGNNATAGCLHHKPTDIGETRT